MPSFSYISDRYGSDRYTTLNLSHPTDSLIHSPVIDDALPVSPNGDPLSLSTGSSSALWPRLLEKAVSRLSITHESN